MFRFSSEWVLSWVLVVGSAAACSGLASDGEGGAPAETDPTVSAGGAGGTGATPGGAVVTAGGGAGGYERYPTCFSAGTLIATAKGETPIELLKLGDVVLGYDEVEHRVVEERVTATFVHADRPIGTLAIGDGRRLRITSDHPVYLPDSNQYVDAGVLSGEERLLGIDPSRRTRSAVALGFTSDPAALETVYNITVDRVHNYFAEGVLVHNRSGGVPSCLPPQPPNALSTCAPVAGCIDPSGLSPEHAPALDAGSGAGGVSSDSALDAGRADAGPDDARLADAAPVDAVPGGASVSVRLCSAPEGDSFVAFDALTGGAHATVSFHSTDESCNGEFLGEIAVASPPNATAEWRPYCVRVFPVGLRGVFTIASGARDTFVRNVRFVTGCESPLNVPGSYGCEYGTGGSRVQ